MMAEAPIEIRTRDGAALTLRRLGSSACQGVVLLIHGASASSDTFLVPDGGLAAALRKAGWEVWLLDWRGSCRHTRDPEAKMSGNFDAVARYDLPMAIEVVRRLSGQARIPVVAHCIGAACLSASIARRWTQPSWLGAVTLTTIGLFFRSSVDNFLKAEDGILERVVAGDPELPGIDANSSAWPAELALAYRAWPGSWLPNGGAPAHEVLRRLTFLYGAPCAPTAVTSEVLAQLPQLFGPLLMDLFVHAGQCVRRGHLAPFDADETPFADQSYLMAEPFRELKTTLITGKDNHLWHRGSVDEMYEWLRNEGCQRLHKYVVPGYGHQDLLWGPHANRDIYPLIRGAIEATPVVRAQPLGDVA